jgi:hypothetical protein
MAQHGLHFYLSSELYLHTIRATIWLRMVLELGSIEKLDLRLFYHAAEDLYK